jgi:hypothetical protein
MIPRIRSLLLVAVIALALQCTLSASGHTPVRPESPVAAKAKAPAPAKPEEAATAKPPATAPKAAVVQPRRFPSPEGATQALVDALRAGDSKALLRILGSEGRTLVSSGDPVVDRQGRERFLQAYDAGHKLVASGNTATLWVGADGWPFPIPVVKRGERWRFDARQGREEIMARRIGRNELYTMQTCLAYVDAQREYYAEDRNGDRILEYAQRFASTPGKRDGLYWITQPGEAPSPLGDLVARARAEGYRRGEGGGPTPFHGYLYRILTAQGAAAPGGAYDYIMRNHMIGGFALVAFPAKYGVSGVMTFIVNHDGVIYQKDLGPSTRSIASAVLKFSPDATWAKAEVTEVAATSD